MASGSARSTRSSAECGEVTPPAGFCEAVSLCGARLAEHFPPTGAAVHGNELDDTLRTSDW